MSGEDDAIMVSPHVKSSFSDSLTTATVTLSIVDISDPLTSASGRRRCATVAHPRQFLYKADGPVRVDI